MSDPVCPSCNGPLRETDYFGPIVDWNRGLNEPIFDRKGGIFACDNAKCVYHNTSLHDHDDGVVVVGYPC
jgi:hypothetical protein